MQYHTGKELPCRRPLLFSVCSQASSKSFPMWHFCEKLHAAKEADNKETGNAQDCTRCMALQIQEVACGGESTLDSGSCSLALPSDNGPQLRLGVSVALKRCLILCAPGRSWRQSLSHIASRYDNVAKSMLSAVAGGCSHVIVLKHSTCTWARA